MDAPPSSLNNLWLWCRKAALSQVHVGAMGSPW